MVKLKEFQMILRKFFIVVLLIGILGIFSEAGSGQEYNKAEYVIGTGDVIEISVWNHPELTKSIRVRPDGWVSFPLIGEIIASNVKPAVLAGNVRQRLLPYLKNPNVSVIVNEYNSKKILVLGEVKKPGLYQYEGGMTVFDAIGLAEGYNKHAQLKSVVVVRNAYSKAPEFYLVNLYNIIHDVAKPRDGRASADSGLWPKDIIYVPKNFIGNVGDAMDYFISRIRPVADTYLLAEIANNQ